MKPRIGGLELNPQVDLALPLLLGLGTALTVWQLAWAVEHWLMVELIAGISLIGFLVYVESYLFTTVFTVREVDVPDALRWVEIILMALLAKTLATWPAADGLRSALLYGSEAVATWVGFALLAFAWVQGYQAARRLKYLHPGLQERAQAQDQLARNDHAEAFQSLSVQAFGQVALAAAVLGVGAWFRGDVRIWGWSWLSFGLLVQALLAAGVLLVGAQLKARITWMQERLTVNPAVFGRWASVGLSLLLVPMLAALILPAGPRLPAEYLVRWINQASPGVEIRLAEPPKVTSPQPSLPPEMIEANKPWINWDWQIPAWVWYLLGAMPVLWLLRVAARQLSERVGGKELKGALALLAALAGWYLALTKAVAEMFGGVVRQALATPAEAVGALFSEAGAVGRLLPRPRRAPGDPRAALRFYFARLQAEAGRRGLGRPAGATAAEFAQKLAAAAPAEEAGEIAELTAAYQEARYSDLPIPRERVSFARKAWVSIVRSLKRR